MCAMQAFSNDIAPCVKTVHEFNFIIEPMTRRAIDFLASGKVTKPYCYVDAFFKVVDSEKSGTLTTRTFNGGHCYETMPQEKEKGNKMNTRLEKMILDGKITDTGQWIDTYNQSVNKENSGTILTNVDKANLMFVTDKEVLNATKDGTAATLTTAHHYSGNIINPQRGQKEMGVKETSPLGFRVRKITPRESFRLMGVSDEDIDKIQAAGISRSQQYKLAGNSIVVDVLSEIFRKLFINSENEDPQQSLF